MIVRLEDLQTALSYLREINSHEVGDITWTHGGTPVPVTQDAIEYWRNVGLGPVYFAKELLFPRVFGLPEDSERLPPSIQATQNQDTACPA